jgi:hypothetical protein
MFRHPVELGCSQSSSAVGRLDTFQELVTGDAAVPTGVEDGVWMMLMGLCRGWISVISNRPETHSQIVGSTS